MARSGRSQQRGKHSVCRAIGSGGNKGNWFSCVNHSRFSSVPRLQIAGRLEKKQQQKQPTSGHQQPGVQAATGKGDRVTLFG